MFQISSRKRLLLLFAVFLLVLMIVNRSSLIEWFAYQGNTHPRKFAVAKHTVPIDSEFEELWELTAYIDCMTCLVSTKSNIYFSGSLKNNSPEFLVNLNLLTGEIEWQKMLGRDRTLGRVDSQYIYVNQSHTQKIADATQMWGAAEIIAYDIDSQDEVWNQKFAGSRGTYIDSIIDGVLMVNAGNTVRSLKFFIKSQIGLTILEGQNSVSLK